MKARMESGFHIFHPPVGFEYVKHKQNKVLVKKEPEASVVKEVFEGFASGRFQTKLEVRYFLENHPDFPKWSSGKIGNTRVDQILSNHVYAGYVGYEPWGVSVRKGQHAGIISYETYLQVQERLLGRANAPAQKTLIRTSPCVGRLRVSVETR